MPEFDASAIKSRFEENFQSRMELGASLSIWKDGKEVLSLAGGHADRNRKSPWHKDTRVLWWSATKGPASLCLVLALMEADIPVHCPVRHVWPEFAAEGKESVTFEMLLSHQAGLAGMPNCTIDPYDDQAVASALANQSPLWKPGSRHGYHPRTFGYLVDTAVLKLTGSRIKTFWKNRIAIPAKIDFWIGIPDHLASSVAPVFAPRNPVPPSDEKNFYRQFHNPDSLQSLAFSSPSGQMRPAEMNATKALTHGFPALGGVGSARGMARFYAILANHGRLDGKSFLPHQLTSKFLAPTIQGHDYILHLPTSFALGFMKDPTSHDNSKIRSHFGPSPHAFGHPGAGGSLAFADPVNNVAFAYCMNQMELGILPNKKVINLVDRLYSE